MLASAISAVAAKGSCDYSCPNWVVPITWASGINPVASSSWGFQSRAFFVCVRYKYNNRNGLRVYDAPELSALVCATRVLSNQPLYSNAGTGEPFGCDPPQTVWGRWVAPTLQSRGSCRWVSSCHVLKERPAKCSRFVLRFYEQAHDSAQHQTSRISSVAALRLEITWGLPYHDK
jgi:hypothetical protein